MSHNLHREVPNYDLTPIHKASVDELVQERDLLVEACHKFSAAHFYCNGEDCTDAHCDP